MHNPKLPDMQTVLLPTVLSKYQRAYRAHNKSAPVIQRVAILSIKVKA